MEGNILEYIIAENFPILGKETDFLVENWKSETGSTQRGHWYTAIKMAKIKTKDRICKEYANIISDKIVEGGYNAWIRK